jgi:AcrR family transcriptional regulator
VSPGGRRPGNLDTRADIIRAAKRVFAADGYDKASLRAVAREAGVDAALVHHYFDGKSDLFIAAMSLPFDPRQVANPDGAGLHGPGIAGADIVAGFLSVWDRAEGTGSSFASCAGAMASSPVVADAMREFLTERVWQVIPVRPGDDVATHQLRLAMVSTQLIGLAFTRYLTRVPPVSTATPVEIGLWAGPTLDRYMTGELD